NYTLLSPISGGPGIQYLATQPFGTITIFGNNIYVNVTYITQYYLTMIVNPNTGGIINPLSGWYDAGSSIIIKATPYPNYGFVSWSGTGNGSYSGTNSQVTITMNGPIIEQANFIELFQVTFIENGLPSGTPWYINLSGGQYYSSSNNAITFTEPNGTYLYTIATNNKEYYSNGGSFIVNGYNLEIGVKFKIVNYSITFKENGLPIGTVWFITFNGTTQYSNT
ncbi:MAG: InlB B-repeat-containing protein, partial [Thermoplasmata archaeon]